MDFTDKELKVLLQALYRYRGEVSGASQSEQNKAGFVAGVIDKIESKIGPVRAERTGFDREMEESLSVLATGRAGAAKAKAAAKAGDSLDKAEAAPKVKAKKAAASGKKAAAASGKKAAAPKAPAKPSAGKTRSK